MELEKLFVSLLLDARDYAKGLSDATRDGLSWASDFGKRVSAVLGKAFLAGLAIVTTAMAGLALAAVDVSRNISNAADSIQSELGTTAAEAERLANIAAQAWGNNFAESIEESAQAVGLVRQQLGDLADDELLRATENAFRLRDAFGLEVNESIDAASTLMEQFGLSSDQAFDFITTGIQRGLNRSGDFIDSITEYSNQFSNAGATADDFFSLMENGLAGGVLGTDKAADAFKEFSVRIQDGSTGTADALDSIGISTDDLLLGLSNGTISVADAFTMVMGALNQTDDATVQFQSGVALLGTQFEDLGTEGALALSLIGTSLEDVAGATEALDVQYNDLGEVVEGFKRKFILAFEPVGATLLELANDVMPAVEAGFAFFANELVPVLQSGADAVAIFVGEIESGTTPTRALRTALETMIPPALLDAIIAVSAGLAAFVIITTVVGWIGSLVAAFTAATAAITVSTTAVGAIVAILGGPVTAAIAGVAVVMAALAVAWSNDWGGIRTATVKAWGDIKPALDAMNDTNADTVREMTEANRKAAKSLDELVAQGRKIKDVQEIWGGFGTLITGTSHEVGEARRDIVNDMATASDSFDQFAGAMEDAFGIERTAQTDAQLQKLFDVATATRELQEQAESLVRSDQMLIASTQSLSSEMLEFTDAQIASASISDTLLIQRAEQASLDNAAAVATQNATVAMEAERQAAIGLIPVFNESAGLVREFLEAQDQLADANGFELVNGRWVDSAEVAQERVTAANDAIINSYRVTAFEATLAQTGVTEATLQMGVALGVLSQDEADLRLEVANTTQAINDLVVSEGFAALSAKEQAEAVNFLAEGYAESADSAVHLAENTTVAKIEMTKASIAAQDLRAQLDDIPNDVGVTIRISTVGDIPDIAPGAQATQAQAFFSGGFTGNVSPNQIAGVVHGQEFVIPANVVDALGLPFLENLIGDPSDQFDPRVPNRAAASTSGLNQGSSRSSTFNYINNGSNPQDPQEYMMQRQMIESLQGGS